MRLLKFNLSKNWNESMSKHYNSESYWHAVILTLFPEIFPGPLNTSLAGKALKDKIWRLDVLNFRDFVLESAGKVGSIKLGTFDMSPDMLKAAAAGEVEFLIDQQQYLQGYLPIAIFAQYMRWGTMPAGVVMTGPGFVTPKNASKVIKWAAQGYR